MASFGPRLKKEREQRGIALEEIAQTTKISTRFLHALEDEKFDQLPGGIFNKGFIRAYARHLGLDEEQAIVDYLAATGAIPAEKKPSGEAQAPAPEVWREAENDGAASLPWGLFAVALLIVALGFAAWSFYSREAGKTKQPVAVSTKRGGDASLTSSPAVQPSTPTRASVAGPSPAAGSAHEVPAPKPGSSVTVAAPGSVATAASRDSTPAAGNLVVRITAREDSWISITSDGREVMRGTFVAPGERAIRADKEIVVRAGNVGALDFEFGGRKLPSQGDYGEVKTLTFNANGLQPSPPRVEAPSQQP